MKIGELGDNFVSTEKVAYHSDRTFIEFDYLMFDLSDALRPEGIPLTRLKKRNEDFKEFIYHKKVPLIVFSPHAQEAIITDRGLRRSQPVTSVLLDLNFSFAHESGRVLNPVRNTPFTSFFSKYKDYFHYTSIFTKYNGKVLLETPYTKKTISFLSDKCLILPPLKRKLNPQEENDFLKELVSIMQKKMILRH